jgi:hypothetical protein
MFTDNFILFYFISPKQNKQTDIFLKLDFLKYIQNTRNIFNCGSYFAAEIPRIFQFFDSVVKKNTYMCIYIYMFIQLLCYDVIKCAVPVA